MHAQSAVCHAGTSPWLLCAHVAVYSYGVILWELFTGREPWQDKTPMQVGWHCDREFMLCVRTRTVKACADVTPAG